jgi:hypothetical protein
VTNKTEEHQSKGLKRDEKTSGITYHLSKLLGQLVETVKGLRWCSSPRRGTLLVDFPGLVVRPMMRWKRESVTVNEVWWNEKCPKINECCEAWMEVSK